MFSKTFFATIALAFAMTQAVDLEAFLEQETIVEPDEAEQKNWAERATGPEVPGWFRGTTYLAKSKEDKLADLMSQVDPDPSTAATVAPLLWSDFDDMFNNNPNGSFCQNSDEMKRDRLKTSHTQGVVARVAWEPVPGNAFSGIYQTGTDHAFLRFSETTNLTEESTGLLPSLAIKFLIDGLPSNNVVGMPGFLGTGSWNFFKNAMHTRVAPFTEEENPIEFNTIRKKLAEASKRPFSTAVSHIASMYHDGTEVTDTVTPYELVFTSALQFSDEKEMGADGKQVMFYDQLIRDSNEGDVILEVFAKLAPDAYAVAGEENLVKIADVRLLTPLKTSVFGDTRMHFQHVRVNPDMRLWPIGWKRTETFIEPTLPENMLSYPLPAWPETNEEAKEKYMDQVREFGCPFQWLLDIVA